MESNGLAHEVGDMCLEATDLWFAYEEGPSVLKGISLEIKAGDLVALIGQKWFW